MELVFEFDGYKPFQMRMEVYKALKKMKKEMTVRARRADYLARHADLFVLYNDLVEKGVIASEEFWEMHHEKLEEEEKILQALNHPEAVMLEPSDNKKKSNKNKNAVDRSVQLDCNDFSNIFEEEEKDTDFLRARKKRLVKINEDNRNILSESVVDVSDAPVVNFGDLYSSDLIMENGPTFSVVNMKTKPFKEPTFIHEPISNLLHLISSFQRASDWPFDPVLSAKQMNAYSGKLRRSKIAQNNLREDLKLKILGTDVDADVAIHVDVLSTLKMLEVKGNELLRHFWSIMPVNTSGPSFDKGKVIDQALSHLAEAIEEQRKSLNFSGRGELTKLYFSLQKRIDVATENWKLCTSHLMSS